MNRAAENYRPDIDGLRALAVGLVLLFHTGLGFPGGFIGVDVFFVISGFLITGIIQRQLTSDRFRLSHFLMRRIRRIVPAASLMTISVLCVGYVTLLPIDYISLAESAVWQQAMTANIYFWKHTGYFAGPSDLMPLLHTWSLAVEEQFYLLYPIVLVAISRFSRRLQVAAIAALAVASFFLSEWAVHRYPSATFFLLPTRAWELLVGGLLAVLSPKASRNAGVASQVLSLTGIACIMLPAILYTTASPFPGVRALCPCVGAACVVHGGRLGLPAVNRLLAWRPVVHIGQLSSSLYLWHWPCIVFVRHLAGPDPSAHLMLSTLIVSYVLSYASWRFIELPFRTDGGLVSATTKVLAACGLIGASLGLSVDIITNEGLPHRAPKQALHFHAARNDRSHMHNVGCERLNRNDVAVFGDPNGVHGTVNDLIVRVAHRRAAVLDPVAFLTDHTGLCRAEMDGVSLYYDDDHLSTAGSLRLSPMFFKMLEDLISHRDK